MTGRDMIQALGIALALLLINFAIGILAVTVYSLAIAPGQDSAAYAAAAQWIVPWVVGIASPLLFALAGFLAARRRPQRNGHTFALLFSADYVLLDMLVSIPMHALASFAVLATWLVILGDWIAAQLGVLIAARVGGRAPGTGAAGSSQEGSVDG